MVILSRNDSSASSIDVDFNYNEKRILDLGKQLLKGRFFMGTLHEKYHVEKINAYRDVISIDKDEHQLIQQLKDFVAHIVRFYSQENWWVGITTPGKEGLPNAYCFWVEVPTGTPLGKYWFKIRGVKIQNNELFVSLKIERKVEETSHSTFQSHLTGNEDVYETIRGTLEEGTLQLGKSVRHFFYNVTTPKNVKDAMVFVGLLFVACVTGLFEVVKFLSDFLIKFMYAWSHFVRASLPILQIILNFFENIFKVLCTLIAYLWKPPQQPQQPLFDTYRTNAPRKYLTYNRQPSRQGVIITELN